MDRSFISKVGYYLLIVSTFSPIISFLLRNYFNMSYIYTINLLMIFAVSLLVFVPRAPYRIPFYSWLFLSFCAYTLLSDTLIVTKSVNFKYLYSNEFIGTSLMFFIVESASFKKTGAKILKINEVLMIVAFAIILIQQLVNRNFFVSIDYIRSYYSFGTAMELRLPSWFSYYGGSIFVGFMFIPVFAIVLADKIKRDSSFAYVFFLLVAGAVYSFLTRYRWIMLNYIVACLVFVKYKEYRLRKGGLFFFMLVSVVFVGLIVLQNSKSPVAEIINERILEKDRGGVMHGTASTRIMAIQIFSKLFPENPLLGRGMLHGFGDGNSGDMKLLRAIGGRTSQIHVGYLSLFYYYGIVGALIYLSFLISLSVKLYRDSKNHDNWGVFFGFLGFVLANFTLVTFNLLYPGLIILLIYNRYLLQIKDEKPDETIFVK